MGGYKVESHWEVIDNKIYRIHAFVPIEGTAEEAALNLSRLQFMSLPDNVAYEFRALAEDWIAGSTYYGPEDDSDSPRAASATRGSCASASRRMYPNQTGPRQLPHHFGPRSFPVRRETSPRKDMPSGSSQEP